MKRIVRGANALKFCSLLLSYLLHIVTGLIPLVKEPRPLDLPQILLNAALFLLIVNAPGITTQSYPITNHRKGTG